MTFVKMKTGDGDDRVVHHTEVQKFLDLGWTAVETEVEEEEPTPDPEDYAFEDHDVSDLTIFCGRAGIEVDEDWKKSDYVSALRESDWRPE